MHRRFEPTRIVIVEKLKKLAAMDFWKPLIIVVLLALIIVGCNQQRSDWRTASRESAGIAPDPAEVSEAVVHVYGADAWGWRGWFAIHTWIATKRADAEYYTVYDVVGWRGFGGGRVVGIRRDVPDRYWYGARPKLLKAHSGHDAELMIQAIDAAARAYPWPNTYKAYPGPNSNTFVAWVGEQVPQLELNLPFSAIGSGYVSEADS